MTRDTSVVAIAVSAFAVVEITLGVLLHTASGGRSGIYSFIAVVLAFLFCFFWVSKSPRYIFTQLALLFTVIADHLLIFHREECVILAMCSFSLTQLSYAARLYVGAPREERRIHLSLRIAAVIVAFGLTAIVLGGGGDALAYISLFYFANLVTSAVLATVARRREAILAAGLWFFVLCDIFVGFSMIGSYLPLPDVPFVRFLVSPPVNMAWVFYLPCLILLAVSPLRRSRVGR